jgi:hypothetical protein
MANRFLNNITINDEYTLPNADGTENQIIVTDGAGNLSFNDISAISGAVKGVESDITYYEVKNSSGAQIVRGKGVMAVGTDGNSGHILIDEMVADGSVEARYFLGILDDTLNNGDIGRVIAFGEVDQINTTGQNGETWTGGQVLWCDPDSAGDFTTTEPDGPNVKIPAAFILKASTQGKIQVRVQANEGIHQLHDTKIASQVDGDVLVWNNTTGVWLNDSTLNVDYTNGTVGIGTTNPGNLLELETASGSTGSEGIFVKSPFAGTTPIVSYKNPFISIGTTSDPYTTATATLYLGESATATGQQSKIEYNATSNKLELYGLGTGSLKHVEFGNPGSVTPRTVFYGDVGIGTTSPQSELHVSGAIQNDQFVIPNTAGTSGQVLAWPATGTTLEWTTAGGGGGGASELNDLSDCETTATSVYVGNAPASNSGETNNTTLGVNAGNSITTGSNNTILGHYAAGSLTTYSDNVVIGYDAASQTAIVGANSVVIGSQACRNGGANSGQVAIGYQASFSDGATNGVSIGYQAGYVNDASNSVNVGYQAGYSSGGLYGVNIGYQAGYYHAYAATYNVSIGIRAGYYITSGDENVSIGTRANDSVNVSDTVIIGTDAGSNGAADGAIYIGHTAANKSGAYGSGVDSIVIGHLAAASNSSAANEVTISPDQGTTNARFSASATAWTFSSDARLKENVENLELGLDFIDQIQPRTFDWKKSGKKGSGFIAQELLEVVENNNAGYTNIVNTDDAECYTVAQAALVPILVNAIKELKAEIDILKSKQ